MLERWIEFEDDELNMEEGEEITMDEIDRLMAELDWSEEWEKQLEEVIGLEEDTWKV